MGSPSIPRLLSKYGCSLLMNRLPMLLWLFFFMVPASAYAMDIAVIVHPGNTEDTLSLRELSRLFKQEKQYWEDNSTVYLIMQEDGTPEKDFFVNKVFRMRPNELKRFWLTKIIKGEILSFPKTLSSNDAIKRFVSQIPSAIGYINARFVDETVKVLTIDGKRPGEEGYYLSGE